MWGAQDIPVIANQALEWALWCESDIQVAVLCQADAFYDASGCLASYHLAGKSRFTLLRGHIMQSEQTVRLQDIGDCLHAVSKAVEPSCRPRQT